MILRRPAAVLVLCAIGAGPASAHAQAQAQAPADPEIEAGIRQVQEGDFETAVITLESAFRRLSKETPRSPALVQAAVQLGVAYVALEERSKAKARFKDALAQDPALRLSPERHSPKVIALFEEARRERTAEAPQAPSVRKRSAVPWVVGGVVVAGGAVALATRGGGTEGTVAMSGARFGTPVLVCPDGASDLPLPVSILVEARNDSKEAAVIRSVTATLVIVTSALPGEVGFASSLPATAFPTSIPAGGSATVRVDTSLVCGNGAGDEPRFNEWSGRLTLTTTPGVFSVTTTDLMRVNIP